MLFYLPTLLPYSANWSLQAPLGGNKGLLAEYKRCKSRLFGAGQPAKKPIVTTQFVEWASSAFARPEGADSWRSDCESRPHHERVWRYARNRSLREEAAGEIINNVHYGRVTWRASPLTALSPSGLVHTRVSRLETQAFHSRCPLPPAVVLFHPYEQHAAVASKDNFGSVPHGPRNFHPTRFLPVSFRNFGTL